MCAEDRLDSPSTAHSHASVRGWLGIRYLYFIMIIDFFSPLKDSDLVDKHLSKPWNVSCMNVQTVCSRTKEASRTSVTSSNQPIWISCTRVTMVISKRWWEIALKLRLMGQRSQLQSPKALHWQTVKTMCKAECYFCFPLTILILICFLFYEAIEMSQLSLRGSEMFEAVWLDSHIDKLITCQTSSIFNRPFFFDIMNIQASIFQNIVDHLCVCAHNEA